MNQQRQLRPCTGVAPHEIGIWLMGLAIAAAWAVAGPARAGDGHAAPSARPLAASAAGASASAVAPKAVAAVVAAPEDPLQVVQRRLAEKLGGQRAADDGAVVRVVARSSTTPAAAKPVVAHGVSAANPSLANAHAGHTAHWSYDGEGGPADWGRIRPEFAACSSGKRQSPIDIRDGIKLSLDAVQFDYKATAFKVQDNGHTIQVNLSPGNSIEVLGERYELLQFHFHRPSEESIDGRRFDMVAHLVHKSLEGRLAVVAVLLERGSAQSQLQQVWNNLPLEKGDSVNARGTLDVARLLPEDRRYFTYMGSLTTPPCSEGVLWMVMKQPVQASGEQLGVFARLYPMNARPIQSAAGRLIKESN